MAVKLKAKAGKPKLPKLGKMLPPVKKPVKAFIHSAVGGYERRRPVTNLHASDVTNDKREYCPRESGLILITGTPPSRQYINTALRWTFDLGWAMEETVQRYLLPVAVGDWKCSACGKELVWKKIPTRCLHCHHKKMVYTGARFISEHSGISCGVDFLGKFPGTKKIRPVEIKTMDKDEFRGLKAPLSEHVTRTRVYLRAISECGDSRAKEIDTSEASILYMCKGFGMKDEELLSMPDTNDIFSPFKEFIITRNDESIETAVNRGRTFTLFKEGKTPLPKGVCKKMNDPRAKDCPVKQQCFGGEYDDPKYRYRGD